MKNLLLTLFAFLSLALNYAPSYAQTDPRINQIIQLSEAAGNANFSADFRRDFEAKAMNLINSLPNNYQDINCNCTANDIPTATPPATNPLTAMISLVENAIDWDCTGNIGLIYDPFQLKSLFVALGGDPTRFEDMNNYEMMPYPYNCHQHWQNWIDHLYSMTYN